MADYKTISCIALLLTFISFNTATAQLSASVVGVVGSEKVTYSELEQSFNKGNLSSTYTLSELESYLPLYLDYKAKLLFAREQGYFSDSTIQQEHGLYSKQAAYAHWLNNEIRPTLFDIYYERAQSELKAFHILIAPSDSASTEDIEAIKAKLLQAKNDIKNGMELEAVNKKYSTYRNGRSMGGDLPWVSAGRFVKEFEDQVYKLKPGQISEPFKSQFGYHIALLQAKRKRTPAKLLSHIFIRSTQDSTAAIKIENAFELLEAGEEWNKIVAQFTEDGSSARNNGSIGWVSSQSNYAPTFLDQIRQLDITKEYSNPIKTAYGHHIFRIDSVQTYESEEHEKKELMQEFEKSNYYQNNKGFAVQYIVENYGSAANEKIVHAYLEFITAKDSVQLKTVQLPKSITGKTLFSFNKKKYGIKELHKYLIEIHGSAAAGSANRQWVDDYITYEIDKRIIEFTLQEYPDFATQIDSYLKGLIIYQLNDEYMWSAATVDSSKLRSIYEKNPEIYTYPERPYFYMFAASKDSILLKAKEFIQQGNSPDSLRNHIVRVSVMSDSLTINQDKPYDRLNDIEIKTFSEIFEFNNRKAMFYLIDRLPARRMTFEESFNRLLTEYQPVRKNKWLQELREKYNVTAKTEILKKAYQKKAGK